MTTTETAPSRRRGPYRKRARLQVADADWRRGDTVTIGRVRWIFSSLSGHASTPPEKRDVVLHASNTVNHGIEWRTTLNNLPCKPSKETR